MGRIPLFACAALLAACGGDRVAARAAPGSLLSESSPLPGFSSPARWRYHPRSAAPLLARLPLKDGAALFAGERGERWLSPSRTHGPLAAAQLAPEPLVSILRASGSWLFVGASGTGYEALEPLGPFVRSSAPIEPLARISAAGKAIAGVRRDGRLLRSSDGGVSWQVVGPEQPRFADVVLTGKTGLALSVPEKLWATDDEGASWKSVEVPPVGALGLAVDAREGAVVRSLFGPQRLSSGPKRSLERLNRSIEPEQHELGAELPRGPDAEALATGRAFFDGDRYFEVAERDRGKGFVLWSGPIDAALHSRPVERADGCREVRLAGFGRYLVLGCARRTTSRIGQTLELYASTDGGQSFAAEPYAVEGRLVELGLAVGGGGVLLVTGACAPHASSSGCSPAGVHRVDLQAKRPPRERASPKAATSLVPAATPALDGSALALAFSVDGKRAYLVGRRTKNGGLSLFVSHDAGKTFEARELEGLAIRESSSEEGFRESVDSDASFDVESLTAAEDGALALVVKSGDSRMLVVTDEDGRVIAMSRPPHASALIGAAGSRALAIVARTQSVWESTDGGASWDAIGSLPLDPCPDRTRCEVSLRCHPGGCVVGGVLSRLGWRGQAAEDQALVPPPGVRAPDVADRKLRSGISCTLDAGGWRPLAGVSRVPSARDAALGKTTWYVPATDDARGAAWVVSVTAGERGGIETTSLLPPVARPETHAYYVSPQVEGVAALRYVIPEARPGETRLSSLEIAWQNLLEGRLGRARLADAGPFQTGDYRKGDGAIQDARPDLLSIASGGVYLRVHQAAGPAQPTLFFDGRSVQRVPPVEWPLVELGQARTDMVHVGTAHVPLMLVGNGIAVVRARRQDSGWSFDAVTTGLPQADAFGLEQTHEVAYLAGRAGLHLTQVDSSSAAAQGWLMSFRADGAVLDPPSRVPTQLDSAERPVRCTAEQMQKTARVVAPFQPGTRHPIIVADAVEPLRVLLTGAAVLHGTPDAACVAAFDAQSVIDDPHGPNERVQAILPLAELERSWLFRLAADSDADDSSIEAHAMKCRFESSLEVPPEVYQAPGTSVKRFRH